ncbi:MAG: hypothetical protein IT385_09245 [Deltaproteobacteria bacterium]|nr:hypothetical protein [Deltaproteobacteria bacterium]
MSALVRAAALYMIVAALVSGCGDGAGGSDSVLGDSGSGSDSVLGDSDSGSGSDSMLGDSGSDSVLADSVLADSDSVSPPGPRLHAAVAVPGHLVAVRVDVDDPTLASALVDGHVVRLHRGRGVLTVMPEDAPSLPTRALGAGDLELSGERVVAAGDTLTIPAGARVVLAPDARLVVHGALVVTGTAESPVLFTAADPARPWAAIDVRPGGRAELDHAWLVRGGADHDRFGGHSGSDPFLAAVDATLVMRGGGIVDGPGKAFYTEDADVTLAGLTIARTDTGGEHVGSRTTLTDAWIVEIPDADGRFDDDDNDALYLRLGTHTIEDVVLSLGEDDGIDHNGADLTARRVWIDGFRHEGVATSDQGTVVLEDLVVRACDQGVEAGYGAPDVTVRRAWITACGVGLRWGDDYTWEAKGRLAVSHTIALFNDTNVRTDDPQQGEAPDGAVSIGCSAVDTARWDGQAGNVAGAPPADGLCPPPMTACEIPLGPTTCP